MDAKGFGEMTPTERWLSTLNTSTWGRAFHLHNSLEEAAAWFDEQREARYKHMYENDDGCPND